MPPWMMGCSMPNSSVMRVFMKVCLGGVGMWVNGCGSAPLAHGLALLDEGPAGLAGVFGLAPVHVVRGLEVEAVVDVARHGAVEVFLHVAVGDGRAGGQ